MDATLQIEEEVQNEKALIMQHPMAKRIFRDIVLADFANYDELKNSPPEIDEEKRAENVEMTE